MFILNIICTLWSTPAHVSKFTTSMFDKIQSYLQLSQLNLCHIFLYQFPYESHAPLLLTHWYFVYILIVDFEDCQNGGEKWLHIPI